MEQLRRSKSTSPQRCTGKKKKGFLARAVERCRSLGRRRRLAVPEGCFAVLVGPGRERFAVRAERANHPLFRALLEEAEAEYGFPRPAAGPLVLPCGVETFRRVMSEVEGEEAGVVECGAADSAPMSPAVRFFLVGGARGAGYEKMSTARTAGAS